MVATGRIILPVLTSVLVETTPGLKDPIQRAESAFLRWKWPPRWLTVGPPGAQWGCSNYDGPIAPASSLGGNTRTLDKLSSYSTGTVGNTDGSIGRSTGAAPGRLMLHQHQRLSRSSRSRKTPLHAHCDAYTAFRTTFGNFQQRSQQQNRFLQQQQHFRQHAHYQTTINVQYKEIWHRYSDLTNQRRVNLDITKQPSRRTSVSLWAISLRWK